MAHGDGSALWNAGDADGVVRRVERADGEGARRVAGDVEFVGPRARGVRGEQGGEGRDGELADARRSVDFGGLVVEELRERDRVPSVGVERGVFCENLVTVGDLAGDT